MEKHNNKFGVPESLVSDNGLQFDSKVFRKFCNDLGIKNKYSTQRIRRVIARPRLLTR